MYVCNIFMVCHQMSTWKVPFGCCIQSMFISLAQTMCEKKTTNLELCALLFANSVLVPKFQQIFLTAKCCGIRPPVYSPNPRRLESLTFSGIISKAACSLHVFLKTLSVGLARVWTRNLQHARPMLNHYTEPRASGRSVECHDINPVWASVMASFDDN